MLTANEGDQNMIYKCKNCGGNVVYDPDRKAMHCPYCDGIETQDKAPGGEWNWRQLRGPYRGGRLPQCGEM